MYINQPSGKSRVAELFKKFSALFGTRKYTPYRGPKLNTMSSHDIFTFGQMTVDAEFTVF
jgi:hypothetical protein